MYQLVSYQNIFGGIKEGAKTLHGYKGCSCVQRILERVEAMKYYNLKALTFCQI